MSFKEILKNIRRYWSISIDSVGIIMITVFLLGMYLLAQRNVKQFLFNLEDKVEIVAFLKDGVSSEQIDVTKDYFENLPNVKEVLFVSKEEALREFTKDPELKKNIEFLDDNPLPDSFSVRVYDKDESSIEMLADVVGDYEDIEEVIFSKDELKNINRIINYIHFGALVIGGFGLIFVFTLLGYVKRITILYRHKEVSVMHAMGATHARIKLMFFVEAFIIGIVASSIGLSLLWAGYSFLSSKINIVFLPIEYIAVLGVIGIFLEVVTKRLAIGRCLRVKYHEGRKV